MESPNIETNEDVAQSADKSLQEVLPDQLRDVHSRRNFLIKLRNLSFAAIGAIVFGTDTIQAGILRGIIQRPTKEQTAQLLQTYVPETPVLVKGKLLQQVGVAHSVESYSAHEEDIEAKIKNAPRFIFLEYFDEEIARDALPSSAEPINKRTNSDNLNNSARAFFSGVGKIAAKESKDIIVVNPQSDYSSAVDSLGVLGLTGAVLYGDLKALKDRAGKNNISSRRDFLKLSLKTAGRVVAYGVGVPRILEKTTGLDIMKKLQKALQDKGILTNDLTEEEQAEILKWYEIDWRNVCSAQGIEAAFNKYSDEITTGTLTPMFQGLVHTGMVNYLTDPGLRDKKDASYLPYNLGGNRQVRRYHYDQQANNWKLVDTFPY